MKYFYLAALCLLFFSTLSHAETIKITTWNLEHMMSKSRFDEWTKHKAKYSGKQPESCEDSRPKYLTYCDALDGTTWTKESCSAQITKGIKTWSDFEEKITGIKQRIDELDSDIFALQEFSDSEALRLLFSEKGYVLSATAKENTPQNIGFAVKKGVFKRHETEIFDQLAIDVCDLDNVQEHKQCDDHWTRPGLELHLETLSGFKFVVLNTHLKSGCRFHRFSTKYDQIRQSSKHECETLDERKERIYIGCQGLKAQSAILDQWVDENKTKNFIITGDFNRSYQGFGNNDLIKGIDHRNDPDDDLLIVPQELDTVELGLYDSCHTQIDWFAFGKQFFNHLGWTFSNRPVATGRDFRPYAPDKVKPADHCPVTLSFEL